MYGVRVSVGPCIFLIPIHTFMTKKIMRIMIPPTKQSKPRNRPLLALWQSTLQYPETKKTFKINTEIANNFFQYLYVSLSPLDLDHLSWIFLQYDEFFPVPHFSTWYTIQQQQLDWNEAQSLSWKSNKWVEIKTEQFLH